ncbi:MAG: UDP-N-acetylglucosamine 2-epimerase (non-hydrolyzing) [Clostridia bacterium]|nr:UDP-N-acetylglucosamine 2-epimerase (non-hydrolyzing) [Clostridia bacterium]
MKTVFVIFGTRPEAVKMCPLVKILKENETIRTLVCVTGQHREMLDDVLKCFSVEPDFRLDVFSKEQSLSMLYARILSSVGSLLSVLKPDLVLVHGDTATAAASALAAFLSGISVGHVEAGLRSGDLSTPYPEEMNRILISQLSECDFAPTESARANLLAMGKREDRIFVTGNTVIDALGRTVSDSFAHPLLEGTGGKRILFLTCHRRENFGEPIRRIFRAVLRIAEDFPDVRVICPIHKNPSVREAGREVLGTGRHPRIFITEPLGTVECHNIMARSAVVLTDSGGIQEEAPALGKPVIILRESTERPEGVLLGGAILCGSDEERIYRETARLLTDSSYYETVARIRMPYGDGNACGRIAAQIAAFLAEGAPSPA